VNVLDPQFWLCILVSVVCGCLTGLERQLRGKPTGMRTSTLICLGAAVFVRLGATLEGGSLDPTRVIGQVVVGVGFLGAGVILARGGSVKGVTSAAEIWLLSAIGSAIGLDHYLTALALAVATVAILTGIELLDGLLYRILRRERPRE